MDRHRRHIRQTLIISQAGMLVVLLLALLPWSSAAAQTMADAAAARADAARADADDFVITVKTNNFGFSLSNQFTIPVTSWDSYNYNVDCDNDGTNEVTGVTGAYTCQYSDAGTYTIRIKDNTGMRTGFPRIYFANANNDRGKLLFIEQWGTGKWSSMAFAFAGCYNLNGRASDAPDLSQVTELAWMFYMAASFNSDIGHWDTSTITDMSSMFYDATSFNQDIGHWDTSNVMFMSEMFRYASSFNQDIGAWDTSNVTDMDGMFWGASSFNQNISAWDTSQATDFRQLFFVCRVFNQPLADWNTSQVTDMREAFSGAYAFNQDIGNWDTSSVTSMMGMFDSAHAFNQDLGAWDTQNVTDMDWMFSDAYAFNQDLGGWNVSALTSARNMFVNSGLDTQNYDSLLIGWDTQNLQPDVQFAATSSYCLSESARANMIASDRWIISDLGKNCSPRQFFFFALLIR